MKKLQRILVGLDFEWDTGALTEGSTGAARQAIWLAEQTGARLELLHSTYVDAEDAADSPPQRAAPDRDGLDSLFRELGADPVDLVVVEVQPWLALIRRVLAGEADLVVVAKRNRSRREDRKLGGVSLKLIRKCPAPVWVVKPGHGTEYKSIVVATDLSPVGDRATEYGASLADALEGADLHVVHAWQVPFALQMEKSRISPEELERRHQAIVDEALDHVLGVPGVRGLGQRAHVHIACDSPSRAVLRIVDQAQADMLVMGTISRGGLAGLLVGNTAEKLLYRVDCSLLTVKPADFVCPIELPAAEDAAVG